jgi:egghead protein (zeste-white 4 protein)
MNILLEAFLFVVVAHWMIVSTFTIIGMFGYLLYKPTKKGEEYKDVDIVIVTKASKSVEGVLFDTIKHNATLLSQYPFKIVIDEGSELYPQLKSFITNFKNVELVIVPKSFTCTAIAKGRAIEYFIRTQVNPARWYTFVDDDNHIMDRKFLQEISYYSQHGYKAANAVLQARRGRSKVSYVADIIRYYEDLTVFRFCTGLLKTPLNGFHGEMLIASGEVLKLITFNRKTITEDFAFSCELVRKNIKTWQSETIVSIQSPHTITDFIKQRNRWYRGISKDTLKASWKTKLFFGIKVIDWRLGIIGSWIVFPVWFLYPLPTPISLYCTIGLVYYYVIYLDGSMKLKESLYLYLIPIFGIMETLSPHLRVKDKFNFNIIEK